MDAVEYFKEKARMAQSCRIDCKSCGLSNYKNGTNLGCKHFEYENPDRAIEIVENWSKAHPRKTQADLFFERYPNAVKDENGIPEILPCDIGILCENSAECCKFESCGDCREKYWLAPVEG